MRSFFLLAGSAGAMRTQMNPKYAELEKSGIAANITDKLEGKLSQMGLSMEKMKKTSHESLTEEYHQDLAEVARKAHEKEKSLTAKQSLKMLEKHMEGSSGQLIASLLAEEGKDSEVSDAHKKALYVQAMYELNSMYNKIDKERFVTSADCSQQLSAMFRTSMFYWDNVYYLMMDMGWVWYRRHLSMQEINKAITAKNEQEIKNEEVKDGQQEVRKVEEEKLMELEADVTLYGVIMDTVGEQCSGGGAGEGTGLLEKDFEKKSGGKTLLQAMSEMSTADRALVEKTCAAKQAEHENNVLLKIFSDPRVETAIEKSNNPHLHKTYKHQLSALQTANSDVVHPKYQSTSFLQRAESVEAPGYRWDGVWKPNDWFINNQGVSCNADSDGCEAVGTMVGVELECRKQKVLEQKRVMQAHEAKWKKENEFLQGKVETLISEIQMFTSNKENSEAELVKYNGWYEKGMQNWADYHEDTMNQRFKCYLQLQEIEENSLCAIKSIRQFMLNAVDQKMGLQRGVDYGDCTFKQIAQQEMCQYVTGDRSTGDVQGTGESFNCISNDQDKIDYGMQEWHRGEPTDMHPEKQTQKMAAAIKAARQYVQKIPADLKDIGLPCQDHEGTHKWVKCNHYTCPVDCAMTTWSDWTACSAECDGGKQSRSSQVLVWHKNGGMTCPDLEETIECNIHDCSVDCVLSDQWEEDVEGCMRACTAEGQDENDESTVYRRTVVEKEQGLGKCPDINSEHRADLGMCASHHEQCSDDFVCGREPTALTFIYENSQFTTKLGSFLIASFLLNLLDKIEPVREGFEFVKLAMIKFGNGESIKQNGVYQVTPAKVTNDFTSKLGAIKRNLMADARNVAMLKRASQGGMAQSTGNEGKMSDSDFKLGFPNLAQALQLADELIESRRRQEEANGDVKRSERVIIFTRGKKLECTDAKNFAGELEKKYKARIAAVVFAEEDSEENKNEGVRDVLSWPAGRHKMHIPGLHILQSKKSRQEQVSRIIPLVCPSAFDPETKAGAECEVGVVPLHHTSCASWATGVDLTIDYTLPEGQRGTGYYVSTLQECGDLARAQNYTSFLYTQNIKNTVEMMTNNMPWVEESADANVMSADSMSMQMMDFIGFQKNSNSNCWTHPVNGKKAYFDEKGNTLHTTCDDLSEIEQAAAGESGSEFLQASRAKGTWLTQPPSADGFQFTTHYGVLLTGECPQKKEINKNRFGEQGGSSTAASSTQQ